MAERIKKQVLDMKDDPDSLEDLYRSDPENFKETFFYRWLMTNPVQNYSNFGGYGWTIQNIPAVPLAVLLFSGFFGLMVRIPKTFLTDEWYCPRFVPFFTILAVAAS